MPAFKFIKIGTKDKINAMMAKKKIRDSQAISICWNSQENYSLRSAKISKTRLISTRKKTFRNALFLYHLGLVLDSKLNFNTHIDQQIKTNSADEKVLSKSFTKCLTYNNL